MSPAEDGRPAAVLTIGKFDGVHIGHARLAERTRERAAALGVRAVALVIHPHPARVLAEVDVPHLTTLEERLRLLRGLGMDGVEPLTFDRALAALSPAAFLDRLAGRFRLRGLVSGPDFALGKDRAGDMAWLRTEGARRGFAVDEVPPLTRDGGVVSSGRIRRAIEAGRVEDARRWLGRPYAVGGPVVRGEQRGRTLGFPTANVAPEPGRVRPALGVYAAEARWRDAEAPDGGVGTERRAAAAVNLGLRPTFEDGEDRLSLEAHLLDVEDDLYGRPLRIGFLARLRGEQRFEGVEALRAQIERDVAATRAVWASESNRPI